jgi:hypothetical protein
MPTARLVEALLEGAIASGLCPELWGCVPATGEVLPAQYLLLTRDQPRARARLRRAARGLLALLDAADQAYDGDNLDGCGKFHALAAAPGWLLRPSDPDDSDPDVALIWEREVDHGGDWEGLLEALHRAGSVEWQWAIRRCRALMRLEEGTGTDLAALIGIPTPPGGERTVPARARSPAAPGTRAP